MLICDENSTGTRNLAAYTRRALKSVRQKQQAYEGVSHHSIVYRQLSCGRFVARVTATAHPTTDARPANSIEQDDEKPESLNTRGRDDVIDFVESVEELAAINLQQSLVAVFSYLRGLLIRGNKDKCNKALQQVRASLTDSRVLLAFLMATAPCPNSELPYRATLYKLIKERFVSDMGETRAEEILCGLE